MGMSRIRTKCGDPEIFNCSVAAEVLVREEPDEEDDDQDEEDDREEDDDDREDDGYSERACPYFSG